MKFTNQNLYLPTKKVDFKKEKATLQHLVDTMHNFMIKNRGIGLSANQIGIRKSIFVMDINGERFDVINPEIITESDEWQSLEEGCLSFPDKFVSVSRPKKIFVKYQDTSGTVKEKELEGLASQCFQHEYDHLHGITMFERSSNGIIHKEEIL